MASSNRLVIGLDYGTTYTGVAYCDSSFSNIQQIQLVTDWPGVRKNATDEKVPSQVAYGQFKKTDATVYDWGTWGNLIPANAPRQVWTKLQLDNTNKRPRELAMLLALLSDDMDALRLARSQGEEDDSDDGPPLYPGKEPVDVVTDFLTGVKDCAFSSIQKTLPEGLFDSLELDVVITVPAVWSDKAKSLTFQAVSRAGFASAARIKMVTEPEAAAIYTLKSLKEKFGRSYLQPGDHFVLCDAGGGTVDLLSYKIKSVEPTFRVEEAAVGTGDKCGATFVDRNFMAWLKKKLGDKCFAGVPKDKIREGSKLRRDFEVAKINFDGGEYESFLSLPKEAQREDPDNGFSDGELRITTEDLEEMFDPCVDRTLELVDGQIATVHKTGAKVKCVFLVGGFGKSNYLFKKLEEYCKDRGMQAMRPDNPWSAVVRGAVARGLEPDGGGMVELRKCRRHYGTPMTERFVPGKHDERDAYIDKLTGMKMAKGQVKWLLNKGDPLTANAKKRFVIECSTRFEPGEDRRFQAQLTYCDEDVAPRRYFEDSVIPLCTVHADMSGIPESKFMRATAKAGGEEFLIAQFRIEMEVDNTLLKFFLVFEGEECGSISQKFDG